MTFGHGWGDDSSVIAGIAKGAGIFIILLLGAVGIDNPADERIVALAP